MQKCCSNFLAMLFNLLFLLKLQLCASPNVQIYLNRDNSPQDLYAMIFVSSLLYELGNRKSSSTISAESKIAG